MIQLSNSLISKFVKASKKPELPSKGTTVYGTVVLQGDNIYVKIDGSQIQTPAETTVEVMNDSRVTALVKDHTVLITGNVSSPTATLDTVNTKVNEEEAEEIADQKAKDLISQITVTNHYLASHLSAGVTYDTPGWTTTVQQITETNRYLWNYSELFGPDSILLSRTQPTIIGTYGQSGGQGYGTVTEISRSFTKAEWETYANPAIEREWDGTSSDIIRKGCRVNDYFTVSGTATDTGDGYTLTFKSSTGSGNLKGYCVSKVVALAGEAGTKIISIQTQFAVTDSKDTEPPESDWKNTQDPWYEGSYLWIRTKITYEDADGTRHTETTEPHCDSSWEVVHNYVPDSTYQTKIVEIDAQFEATKGDYTMRFDETTRTITAVQGATEDNANAISEEVATRTKLINFSVDGIRIGDSEGVNQLRLSDEEIGFIQNGNKISYIRASKQYIPELDVGTMLYIGKFAFIPRANGSLDFRKVKE